MRTLIAKEVRLLMPVFVAAMALAIVPEWVLPKTFWADGLGFMLCWFGAMLLVVSSYGREMGCKTLGFLLTQPVERELIWWSKMSVVGFGVAMVTVGWGASYALCGGFSGTRFTPPQEMAVFVAWFAAVLVSGILGALLLRQTIAAFCFAVLVPIIIIAPIALLNGPDWMGLAALGGYAMAGFFLARRQFLNFQDTAWTGGEIHIGWRRAAGKTEALRRPRMWAALIGKELEMHQVTLLAMACLLALHVGAVYLRKAGAQTLGVGVLWLLRFFYLFWLVMPMVAGSQSVAGERQMGTLEGLLCLPVSRRLQFAIKLIFVLVLGGLLSGTVSWGVEWIGQAWEGPKSWGCPSYGVICGIFLALSLCAFYASTLTRGVATALAAWMVWSVALAVIGGTSLAYYYPWRLWPVVAVPAVVVAFIWLGYGNFRFLLESGRRWRRNVVVFAGVLVLAGATVSAIVHRVWEWAEPMEPEHGGARLPTGKAADLSIGMTGQMALVLPDGRFWEGHLVKSLLLPRPVRGHFVAGSNWTGSIPNWLGVAMRSDGTLWVSEKPPAMDKWSDSLYICSGSPPPMVQFGTETDWQNMAGTPRSRIFLLKRDGSLWRWNCDTEIVKHNSIPQPRWGKPVRVGEETDWARIFFPQPWLYAWKRDGTAWIFYERSRNDRVHLERQIAPEISMGRAPGLDQFCFQSMSRLGNSAYQLGVRDDGTLWYWDDCKLWSELYNGTSPSVTKAGWPKPVQIGRDSNWAAITAAGLDWAKKTCELFGLKTDGSLWKWKIKGMPDATVSFSKEPVRLGTHRDWVCLSSQDGGVLMTLSADGQLWLWPPSIFEFQQEGLERAGYDAVD